MGVRRCGRVVGHDALVDLAGEEALQAADDVLLREAFGGAAGDVVDGRLVEAHAHDGGPVERGVGLAVAAAVEAMPVVMPEDAGIGQAPQSLAKAASERIRSGLSPKTISISAAVSAPMPKPSRRVGDGVGGELRRGARSWPSISSSRSRQRLASARSVCFVDAVVSSIDAGPEPGAAIEQRLVGQAGELTRAARPAR